MHDMKTSFFYAVLFILFAFISAQSKEKGEPCPGCGSKTCNGECKCAKGSKSESGEEEESE